jgi:sialate O-acetylesterase
MKAHLLLITLLLTATAHADVSLPATFSDHMILQADTAAPVWGWASPGEDVTVSIAGQTKSAKADEKGEWRVKLDPLKSGESTTMTVKGNNTITIHDVLTGEVWLCSGQSNMAWPLGRLRSFKEEQTTANAPQLRMFVESSGGAGASNVNPRGEWKLTTPENLANFSATAYFFGRHLHRELKQPVGLLVSAVGGTPIQNWISPKSQRTHTEMVKPFTAMDASMITWTPERAKELFARQLESWQKLADKAKAEKKPAPPKPALNLDPRSRAPGNLFNGKIAPLAGYAIKGAIWYQGESNAFTVEGGKFYAEQLPMLVKDWREHWAQGDFPFAWVQLPNFHNDRFLGWCEVRESMLKTLAVPQTGMAICLDLGEPKDIHPQNKQEVGRRLGLWALAKVYGQNIAWSGPLPKAQQFENGAAVCTFEHAEGLKARAGQTEGFELAGADQTFHPATATIEGEKVIVTSPEVKTPVAVRYAWKDDPKANLVNGAGLPASPFRSDAW